ncbi:LLM class flavin-dependent oxidoreductase [Nocardioides zeae]|uniref:Alkanesulfonate monooxygenase SsuD/methylene tetrahydromethanopterin reductase-like flavin-dependent oxidoreductase (Luciferase family) n=1 Tax=Nocardioides zeae TaxID=1457234 RepID=A0AAJ1WYU9_9ACTN|nr:LLM class flavin-dependent oxidoreductase [Nocardioides zeae]MDQ1102998.1 alkanesulfonate monooxygenase SsuD/methylene tetrahydromethanopterin reductase-like flavin-dependent oxidoreductase (luciferase family) [Nocardioides zeae]
MTSTAAASPPLVLLNAAYLSSSRDWRTPAGRDTSPFEVSTFVREARQAEAAGVDVFFQADFSGVQRASIRSGPPVNAFEPFQLAALVASATDAIAVMPTVSTLHTHPFTFARNLASLDRIARGRAWVNVVSSFRSGTGLGVTRTDRRGDRHAQTEEFVTLARKLWRSWPPEALVADAASGTFVATELIEDVGHQGEFYAHEGPIDMAPFSAAFPFTLQATTSLAGLALAARTADGVFAGTPTRRAAHLLRTVLQDEARAAGRPPDAVRLLPGAFLHLVDDRREAARLRRARTGGTVDRAAAVLAFAQRHPRLDLTDLRPRAPVPLDLVPPTPAETLATLGSAYLPVWDLVHGTEPAADLGDLAVRSAAWGEHAQFVGTVEEVLDELTEWITGGAVDGFQLILGNRFDLLTEEVVPTLKTLTTSPPQLISGGSRGA